MQGTGLLVTAWPIVLGCDASGVVSKVGDAATSKYKVGDRVCGCTRLGVPGFSTFQEYFCMDSNLVLPIPKDLSFQQGATLGVGTYTACLGLLGGLKLKIPDSLDTTAERDEWVVILGGAGSVGQYSVQIAKALGYKVVATCSQKTSNLVQGLGANSVIDYKQKEEDQLQALKEITGGNFFGVWDSVASSDQMAVSVRSRIAPSVPFFELRMCRDYFGRETYLTVQCLLESEILTRQSSIEEGTQRCFNSEGEGFCHD